MRGTLLSAAVALGLAGCRSAEPVTQLAPPSVTEASYRLGPGDKVRVITFGETGLSGEFLVSEVGHIAFPLIGDVDAGGLTPPAFAQELTEKLSTGYLRHPRVSVEVLNYRPFYILGEVGKPGEYPFISGLTVTNAVATAGGFTYRANVHRVFVRGQRESGEHVVALTGTTLVHPGDTIRIPERLF